MSNCIEFIKGTGTVRFSPDVIDGSRVQEYLIRARKSEGKHVWEDWKTDEQKFEDNLWWFFNEKNVSIDFAGVLVRFGEGQSSHTWRDLKYTLNYIIKPLMLQSKLHWFIITDEYDGFEAEERWRLDFKEGMPEVTLSKEQQEILDKVVKNVKIVEVKGV